MRFVREIHAQYFPFAQWLNESRLFLNEKITMLTWFLKLLGISSEITDHLDNASFAFQRSAVFWLGLLLIGPIGYLIYRRQQANLVSAPPALRTVLTACRIAVLVILVSVLASPYVKMDHRIENRPIVAVMVDHSQSMNLPAGPFETEESVAAVARAAGFASADRAVDAEIVRHARRGQV
jgi:hypothetical protein